MIVVSIIGLLAVMVIPAIDKARKQSEGRRIINDARQEDAAIDQWALETGQIDGDKVNTTDAATYLKEPWKTKDVLGHAYKIGKVGTQQVLIAVTTKRALANVGIDWGPY